MPDLQKTNQLFSSVQNTFSLQTSKKIQTKTHKKSDEEYSKLFSKKIESSKCYFRKVYKLYRQKLVYSQVIFTENIVYTKTDLCMCVSDRIQITRN